MSVLRKGESDWTVEMSEVQGADPEGMKVMHILRIGARDHVPEVREKDILRLLL